MTLPQGISLYGKAGSIIVVGLTLLISPGLVAHADPMISSPMVGESQSDSRPVVVDAGVESGDGSQAKVRNKRPVANAGKDQRVYVKASVSLSGAKSKDPDGKIVKYLWKQVGGKKVKLVGAKQAQVTFKAPVVTKVTKLKFLLTVTDNKKATASDMVVITVVPNKRPVAEAGDAQTVNEADTVNLYGSGTDSDGKIVRYAWKQITGDNVTLTGANNQTSSFIAPAVTNTDGSKVLTFRLTVTDNKGGKGSDTVRITVNAVNEAPVVDAGVDQEVDENSRVSLGCRNLANLLAYSFPMKWMTYHAATFQSLAKP